MVITGDLSQKFEPEATAAAVGYIVSRLGKTDFHRIFKALYRADRLHLERYGRMITWEDYSAQEYGPVPMKTYRVMGNLAGRNYANPHGELAAVLGSTLLVRTPRDVTLKAEPDLDELSESDIACLDEAIERVRGRTFGENTTESHDAAWTAAWERMHGSKIQLDDVISLCADADALREHLAGYSERRAV